MNEYLFIYLLQLCDIILIVKILCVSIWCICTVLMLIMLSDNIVNKPLIIINILSIVLSLLFAFFPTKQTLLLSYSVYFGKQALTTELYEKINTIIDLKLDDYIKQLKKGDNE